MKMIPHPQRCLRGFWQISAAIALGLFPAVFLGADPAPISYPPAPDEKLFTALKSASPFQRTLNPSETYALRAVVVYEDLAYARVYNKQTKETLTLEIGGKPQNGLQLVKVIEPPMSGNLGGVKARISFAGEEAELQYDPEQLTYTNMRVPNPRGSGGPGGSGDGRRDGDRKGPSSEEREKFNKLSDENKEKLRTYIRAVVQKYPDMPGEERGNLIRGALQKLNDGRDVEIPK